MRGFFAGLEASSTRAPLPGQELAMAALCALLCVLSVLYLALAVDSVKSESKAIYGAMHQAVTFQLSSSSSTFKDLIWTKDKHKIIDWDGLSQPRAFPPFEGRIYLDTKSGALSISNLSASDEGVYEFFHTKENFSLSVIEPLPSPVINLTCSNGTIIVKCRIPEFYQSHLDTITFSWNCSVPKCADSSTPEIRFNKTEPHPQQVRCIVSNPVSKANSSTTLSTESPVDKSHRHIGIILSMLFVPVLLSVIYVTRRRCKRKPGCCAAGGDKDEAVGSLQEPRPDCNGTEGNMDQSLKLLPEQKPACDTVEDESK